MKQFIKSRRSWIVATALSWLFLGFCNLLAKLASDHLPTTSVAFWWSFGYVPLTFVLICIKGFPRDFNFNCAFYSLSAGVIGQLAALAFYVALSSGMLSVVTTLSSLYPLVTVILAVAWLKERINKRQVIGVAFALFAIVLFCL